MKTYLDCIPCFFSQALFAARQAGCTEEQQKQIIDGISKLVPELPMEACPPENSVPVYEIISRISGNSDPLAEIKRKSNMAALEVYPMLGQMVESAGDRLLAAVETAVSGNIIDYGANRNFDLKAEIKNILSREEKAIRRQKKELFDIESFRSDLSSAKEVLYLGDNAGEIVFDRILVETICKLFPDILIRYAVRGKPIINDVTMEDARSTGMDSLCETVSSGSHAPGTVLKFADSDFLKILERSDIIISKGQGNYEALSGNSLPAYYLLRVKCKTIADHIPAEIGDFCLFREK